MNLPNKLTILRLVFIPFYVFFLMTDYFSFTSHIATVLFILAFGEFTLPVSAYILHYAGILAGIIVLSGYCIWKDAYWGLNNNRKSYGIILVIAGLLNAFPLFSRLTSPDLSDFPYINTLTCVMLLVVGIELLLKHMIDRRADKAEDEA